MVEDRGNKALILIFVIGIGSVLPFNILMNATTFFAAKLDYNKADEDVKNDIERFSNFIVQFMGIAATLPNVFLQIYNALSKSSSGSVKNRLFISIIVQIVCFAIVTGVCFVDAVKHPYLFFSSILILAFLINSAGGLYQNLSFALAANLPMIYTNSVVTGSNVGGIISALASIVSMAVTTNKLYASLVFFVIAIAFVAIQIFTTIALFKNEYYIENNRPIDNQSQNKSESNEDKDYLDERSNQELTTENVKDLKFAITVFKECWNQLLNIFLTFYISLMLFPAVQVFIRSVNDVIPADYFISIFTFLSFNLFATIGNSVTFWSKFPLIRKERVWIFVLLRFLLVPFFLFCNYQPGNRARVLPVLFKSDTVYIIGGMVLGFTSGYFSSLGLMYAPKSVSKPEYAETAAKMGAVCLILGIFCGLASSFGLPYLV